MFKTDLYSLLRTFSSGEMNRFGDFVLAHCSKRNKRLPLVWAEIKKQYPLFADKRFNKERLYTKLYGKRPYRDSTMRSFYHKLYIIAEKFIVAERHSRNYFGYLNFLLEELIDRAQYGLAEKTLDDYHKVHIDKGYTSAIYFERYRLESNRFNFMRLSGVIHSKNAAERNLQTLYKSGEYLAIFFVAEIISDFVNSEIQKRKYNINETIQSFHLNIINGLNIENILISLPQDSEYYYVVEVYYQLFKTFKDFDELEHYFKLKKKIFEHSSMFNKDEQNKLFSVLMAYCIFKKNKDNENPLYQEELKTLYKVFFTKEYYITYKSRYLTRDIYRAALLLVLDLKDFSWAEVIMKKYTIKLQPKDIENMSHFAKAMYFYAINKPEQALEVAIKIKLDNFIYKYDIKNLLLKIYTDIKKHENLYCLIHSYREYLSNDTLLTDAGKEFYRRFMYYLEKLINYRDGKTKIDIGFLLNKIQNGKDFYHRQWLVLKYDETIKMEIQKKI